MLFSPWLTVFILVARVHALASSRPLDNRALNDSCMTDSDCAPTDGYDYTCIHPGHSTYGYCQFKDCRYFGCGNHGLDPCLEDGDGKPWKCGSYASVYASSVSAASAAPASEIPQSSAAAPSHSVSDPVISSSAVQPTPETPASSSQTPDAQSAQVTSMPQVTPVAAAESQSQDAPSLTETGLFTIQTSPPEDPSSAARVVSSSAAASGNSGSITLSGSEESPGSSAATSAAASLDASSVASGSAPSVVGILPPAAVSSSRAMSAQGSSSGSAAAPSRTTLAASGIPTGGATLSIATSSLLMVFAAVFGIVLV